MIPRPFRIKLPLELVASHLDEQGYEFAFRNSAERLVVQKILEICKTNYTLQGQLGQKGVDNTQVEVAIADCLAHEHPAHYKRTESSFCPARKCQKTAPKDGLSMLLRFEITQNEPFGFFTEWLC